MMMCSLCSDIIVVYIKQGGDFMKKIKMHGKSTKYVQVDDEDYLLVKDHKWYESRGYAVTVHHKKGHSKGSKGRNVNIAMHRLLMGAKPDGVHTIDHKDRNKLNNCRDNLRWATYAENSANTAPRSGMKGVRKDCNRYYAKIGYNKTLGSYTTEKEAALVYDKAARSMYGDFAYLNYPNEHYSGLIPHIDYEYIKRTPRSKYRGVSYITNGQKRVKRWRAIFKRKQLGTYHTETEAHKAYEKAYHESEKSN